MIQIPVYNADNPSKYSSSNQQGMQRGLGSFPHKRRHRDSMVCIKPKKGKLINVDCNDAANIGIKSNLNGSITDRIEPSLAMPLRVKFDVNLSQRSVKIL